MKHFLLVLAAFVFFSCSKDTPEKGNDNAKIIGAWSTVTIQNDKVVATGAAYFQENNDAGYTSLSGLESEGGATWYVLNGDRLQVKMANAEFLDGTITSYSTSKIVINLSAGGTTTLTPGTWPPESN